MNASSWPAIFGLAIFLAALPAARAQQTNPRIGYVFPAGGPLDTTFQVTVGGQSLTGVNTVYVSGGGVQAKVIEYSRPLTPRELNELREKLQELQKNKKDAAALKEMAEIRKRIDTSQRKLMTPAIAETVTIQITTAPNAELGERELRLGTELGLSNPMVFSISQVPEFQEKETRSNPNEPGMTITLPAIVNGQILPGDVDRFRFPARRGQRLLLAASARQLIPYLPDAVPGWFQATLALQDAQGHELAYADDFRFNPDPVLFYEIPADGEYVIEIKDSIYRGREDFVYRVVVGELPFVTSIFPLGGPAGAQTTVEAKGWNLPAARVTIDGRGRGPGIYPISVRREQLGPNRVLFGADTLPESLEREPNNQPAHAQAVTPGIIVNGRIDPPGDWDVFSFLGRADSVIVAEVQARRLNSPLDSVLKLTNVNGKQIAFNDDYEDRGAGLTTHHADSRLTATLPADGVYYLHVGDTQQKGGPEYAYRLRLSPPQPDFQLRVVPSSINIRGGATAPITVYALRKDGFTGEIALALKDAPEGFELSGGWMPAHQDKIRLTITVPSAEPKAPVSLSLEGRATVQGRALVHPAVPADDMMQAFAYHHLVPAKELKVAFAARRATKAALKIATKTPVRIPAGGSARVQVESPAGAFLANLQFALSEPPEGISIQTVPSARPGAELVLQSDAAKVKPGLQGNLILTVSGLKAPAAEKSKSPPPRAALVTLPAVPFEIVAPDPKNQAPPPLPPLPSSKP